jgi:aminopeptidase N
MATTIQPKYLADYCAPDFLIPQIFLEIRLSQEITQVIAKMHITRQVDNMEQLLPLVLDGVDIDLQSVRLDGQLLTEKDYIVTSENLTIKTVLTQFTLETVVYLKPQQNTRLLGLYQSHGNFYTQCEAEGFRRITYFLDRPDVLSCFTTKIIADKVRFPVLLSNGNLIEQGALPQGQHFAVWQDPSRKPCYLFALVAGDLACLADHFITMSGRKVDLRFYAESQDIDKCYEALASLKKAMRWDEQVFGREYDLDMYMVVAVSDFNMGAMENKGLNIFNTKYVLANSKTATDIDYELILGVIGHEYFHNWTGNRVTCRDWFQLSLKEGLTVFRDQEFSSDLLCREVKRIEDVNRLRTLQFAQDASPIAHPVRPTSYIEMNNFYTVTVYEKGAEVIRMMHTLLGREGFRKGMDLYFARHDGQAVTCDDFVQALADANQYDFNQFKLWYSQAGTPTLSIATHYDDKQKTYQIEITQSCPATADQKEKQAMHIPFAMGLLDQAGRSMALQLQGDTVVSDNTVILSITEARQAFTFINVPQQPILSALRGFSAPVKLNLSRSDAELACLFAHDTDGFSRWDAGQQLVINVMLRLMRDYQAQKPLQLPIHLADSYRAVLQDCTINNSFKALLCTLPAEAYMAELCDVIDVDAIHHCRKFLQFSLAETLSEQLLSCYHEHVSDAAYCFSVAEAGRRRMKNLALDYLIRLQTEQIFSQCWQQFKQADNMTDQIAALAMLCQCENDYREQALTTFYQQWRHDALVIDKWFTVQAMSDLPDSLEKVCQLLQHPDFTLKNPNRARALLSVFTLRNHVHFHQQSGAGYQLIADQVIAVDKFNPQLAAHFVSSLIGWRRYNEKRQQLMQKQLQRILQQQSLSKDVHELVSKALR